MALVAPTDREFRTLPRGHIRDNIILASFRAGLRTRVNPQTGALFTEDEIARATRPGSRWYIEAQAIDDYGQGRQRNALWLIDQIRADRASTKWLHDYHGAPRGLKPLDATGSSGTASVEGVPGTIVLGSTVIGSPTAYTARDPKGNVFQAFETGDVQSNGAVSLILRAVSTGAGTNIPAGTVLRWIKRDPNMAATCTTTTDFRGGTDRETDADFFARFASIMRHKPAAGNDAQSRAWAREASNSIEDGFVYPCFLHAGTVMVAITQKRAGAVGPLGRFPSVSTLADATSYLVPPLSPVVPPRAFWLVTGPASEPSNLVLRMGMPRGTAAGWVDARPFPSFHATTPQVTAKTSNTDFQITCPGDATLPNQEALATLSGSNAPHIMVWDAASSRFVELNVSSIEDLGSNVYRVLLGSPPEDFTIAVGQIVSPDVSRRDIVAETIEEYFDELGPGPLFNEETDTRGGRCVRFPDASEERPYRAGGALATRVIEALGGSASDADLESISLTTPSYPADLMNGPNQLTLGTVGVYEI